MNKNRILRKIWYGLSSKQRYTVRRLYYYPQDLLDAFTGKTHEFVPPRGKIFTGSPASAQNFISQSNHQLEILKNETGLVPSDAILDIGCGIGRTAISLTQYLDKDGKYEGFDVVKEGIDWCNSKFKKKHSNFNFTYIPLHNDLYNSSGNAAEDFIFPYPENSFDKIFSFSVFTHMGITEIQNYLKEIQKTLTKDGLCLSTFFLYDDTDEDYITNAQRFGFPFKADGYRLMNEKVKSGNIAISKQKLHEMAKASNLQITNIIDGFWKDEIRNTDKIEYQDIVVFKK
ncbi:class I SAM-dependent methyltransferase [Flavobacterium sp.]|uniref:class I SAM-dependent methyltransferase n=1 Tax=Flavobacterium sp. TaxID=239 RepID=UPI003D6C0828